MTGRDQECAVLFGNMTELHFSERPSVSRADDWDLSWLLFCAVRGGIFIRRGHCQRFGIGDSVATKKPISKRQNGGKKVSDYSK
mmetsp:Transcript_4192/g.8726  ORF Transcript_4192/g.8726 Transcript_4192/m.8726 type:complete len:84 (-) Transcript_4192:40-291(-)